MYRNMIWTGKRFPFWSDRREDGYVTRAASCQSREEGSIHLCPSRVASLLLSSIQQRAIWILVRDDEISPLETAFQVNTCPGIFSEHLSDLPQEIKADTHTWGVCDGGNPGNEGFIPIPLIWTAR